MAKTKSEPKREFVVVAISMKRDDYAALAEIGHREFRNINAQAKAFVLAGIRSDRQVAAAS